MNTEKVKVAIKNIYKSNDFRAQRQYPASKAQLAKLAELGILEVVKEVYAPRWSRQLSNGFGNRDAELIIAEATPQTASDGFDSVNTFKSALFVALNEVEVVEVAETVVESDSDEYTDEEAELIAEQLADDAKFALIEQGANYQEYLRLRDLK